MIAQMTHVPFEVVVAMPAELQLMVMEEFVEIQQGIKGQED